jgi:hypothetical protein
VLCDSRRRISVVDFGSSTYEQLHRCFAALSMTHSGSFTPSGGGFPNLNASQKRQAFLWGEGARRRSLQFAIPPETQVGRTQQLIVRDFDLASKKQVPLGKCEITQWRRPLAWQDTENCCPAHVGVCRAGFLSRDWGMGMTPRKGSFAACLAPPRARWCMARSSGVGEKFRLVSPGTGMGMETGSRSIRWL